MVNYGLGEAEVVPVGATGESGTAEVVDSSLVVVVEAEEGIALSSLPAQPASAKNPAAVSTGRIRCFMGAIIMERDAELASAA
jgi:hypothetical protein